MSKEIMELANVAAESIMKLTKENEKLKTELNDFVNIFDGNVSMKKLKEENKKLKEERNRDAGKYLGLLEKNTGLNLEIEELKDTFTHGNIHEIAKKNETLEEQIRLLGEENEKFKSQIPDKKGKKLSQNDKETLQSILDDIPVVNGIPGRVAQFKLLKRLMK